MSIDTAVVLVLFMQPLLGELVSEQTSWYSGSYKPFCPLFFKVPSAIDAGNVMKTYSSRLGSPVSVNLCSGLSRDFL